MTQTRASSRFQLSRGFIFAALIGYALWVVFPMVWMAYSSLKTDQAIFRDAFALPPVGDLQFANYAHAWREAHFGDYFLNSVLVTTTSVALIVALTPTSSGRLRAFSNRVLLASQSSDWRS